MKLAWMDLKAMGLSPTFWSLLKALVFSPGFRLVILYRMSHWCYYHHLKVIAWLLFNINHFLSGCEVKPLAQIGGGLYIPHASGIVIGEGVVIGDNCTIYQNVTLGLAKPEAPAYPQIGNWVRVYAGACVLGGVTVGDGARIGANAVVLTNVPPRATAVGNPATIRIK